ncbi:hypothetical protein M9Y10_004235 [Tritrichomonas musculus]|uniref:Fucosyltransferase n=1 Tax=Tritrichomonas musculus TaxID=1915356 RepID=A0ABR2JS19_9EUKA
MIRIKPKKKVFSNSMLNKLLDVSIIISIIYNFLVYFKRRQYIAYVNQLSQQLKNNEFNIPSTNMKGKLHFLGESQLNVDRSMSAFNYSQTELNEAISELNIPTWSRSYRHCSSSESEVSCYEIIKSWRLIKSWIYSMKTTPLKNRRFILIQHYFDGVGNRISIDAAGFLLALMSNRSLVFRGFYLKEGKANYKRSNAYILHPLILSHNSTIEELFLKNSMPKYGKTDENNLTLYDIQVYKLFWSEDFDTLFNSDLTLNLDHLIYTTVLYAHYITSEFCIEHFGMHAVYFLSNFLVRFPKNYINSVLKIFNPIPSSVMVFGVHLRFQFAGQFYSYCVESTMNKVVPFLMSLQKEMPTIFAFSSDSKEMERDFLKIFDRSKILMTNAVRLPDFDHDSALLDLILLMACDECLLSYRSTFSFAVASRTGKRCWFVEKEAPSVFQATNSQAGAISMLMHYYDYNDWQTSRRFVLESLNENSFRYYFRYFMF